MNNSAAISPSTTRSVICARPQSVSLLGQPVTTALLSIPLLGELLSVQQIIGGALVLVGIYLVNRRGSSGSSTSKQPRSTGGRQNKRLQLTPR